MYSIFKDNCSSSTTITNTPRIEFVVGRKYKDHTVVYKIVNGQKIRLKCIRNTNPLYWRKNFSPELAKAKAAAEAAKVITLPLNTKQPCAA